MPKPLRNRAHRRRPSPTAVAARGRSRATAAEGASSLAGDGWKRRSRVWVGAIGPAILISAALSSAALSWGAAAQAQALPVELASKDPFSHLRHDMVDAQVRRRGIEKPDLLAAMEGVPRHLFVPEDEQAEAYGDHPVASLSQAYVSARMISLLELDGDEKVLEIGTGSGYDAALLSRIADQVYTVEIDPALPDRVVGDGRRLRRF